MTAQIKVKVQRKAIVKFKVLPHFAGQVLAGDGIDVTKTGGDYTVSLDAALTSGLAGYALTANGVGLVPSYQGFSQPGVGAVIRGWIAKAQDVLSATDYGVKADGVTDDRVALQAASDAAVAAKKTLMLPAGNMIVSNFVTPGVASCWIGQGRHLTTITCNHATNTVISVSAGEFHIRGVKFAHSVARNSTAKTFDFTAPISNMFVKDLFIDSPGVSFSLNMTGGFFTFEDINISLPVANTIDFDVYAAQDLTIFNVISGHNPAARGFAHVVLRNTSGGQTQIINSNFFQGGIGLYIIPGNGQSVNQVKVVASYFDNNPNGGVAIQPSGTGTVGRVQCDGGWITGNGIITTGNGTNISELQFTRNQIFTAVAALGSIAGVTNVLFADNHLDNTAGGTGIDFSNCTSVIVSRNQFFGTCTTGFTLSGTTDYAMVVNNDLRVPSTPVSDTSSGTHNLIRANQGVVDKPILPGMPTLAQGNLVYGSAAGVFSALAKDANATRYLANTGTSNNPAWGQVNLTNGVTGTLPIANGGTNDTGTAWTTYTPTLSANSGALGSGNTATGRYKQLGKSVWFEVSIAIGVSGVGTASFLKFTLPVGTVAAQFICTGKDVTVGFAIQADTGAAGSGTALISKYDSNDPLANSHTYVISDVYEAQ